MLTKRGRIVRHLEHYEGVAADKAQDEELERIRAEEHEHEDDGCCGGLCCARKEHEVEVYDEDGNIIHQCDNITKYKAKLRDIDDKLKALDTDEHFHHIVCGFVTFDDEEGALRALDTYPPSRVLWCCQSSRKRLDGNRIWVERAPDPTNIWWENLGVHECKRCGLRLLTSVVSFLVILVSFGVIFALKNQQTVFANKYPDVDCSLYPNTTKVDAMMDRLSYTYRNSTERGLVECYCAPLMSSDPVQMLVEAFDPADPALEADPHFGDYSSPSVRSFVGDVPEGTANDWCYDWFVSFASLTALQIFSSFFTVAINQILKKVIKNLVYLEKPRTESDYYAAVVTKLTIVQIINTGMVTLIVNANLDYLAGHASANATSVLGTVNSLFFTGEFHDFNQDWYLGVGVTLLFNMIVNLGLTPFYPLVGYAMNRLKRCLDRGCSCDYSVSKKKTQHDLDMCYTGPRFDLAYRYAQLLTSFFVCFLYSSGMPLLLLICLLQFVVCFWVDKWAFIRLYKTPVRLDGTVARQVAKLMWWALFLHVLWGIWMYSNPQIFTSTDLLTTILDAVDTTGEADSTIASVSSSVSILTRLSDALLLSVVLALLIVGCVVFRILYPIFSTVLFSTIPCLHYCCMPDDLEGGHEPLEKARKRMVGTCQSYSLGANQAYQVRFALDSVNPERIPDIRGMGQDFIEITKHLRRRASTGSQSGSGRNLIRRRSSKESKASSLAEEKSHGNGGGQGSANPTDVTVVVEGRGNLEIM